MMARAWELDSTEGRDFYIYGPEALTFDAALTTYCSIVKPGTAVAHVPFWLMRIIATLKRNALLKQFVIPFMRYCERVELEPGDNTEADALLGAPTTTVAAWCRARAEA